MRKQHTHGFAYNRACKVRLIVVRFVYCHLLALITLGFPSLRADTVTLSASDDGTGTMEMSGEVVDYTGETIIIRGVGSARREFPAARVQSIDTKWPDGFEEGTAALDAGDYPRAAELLAQAARADTRAWVRRKAMERLMDCYAAAGDFATAGRLLIELARSDPSTPALNHAPLAWYATDIVSPAIFNEWLSNNSSPIAQLLGASFALSGSSREDAIARLNRLQLLSDDHIAPLAEMQSWRPKVVTAKPSNLQRWEKRLRDSPESLQAGGWLVLGDAYRQLRDFDAAALAYLRCHMLAHRQPQLAAEALWRASNALATAGHDDEAARLAGQLQRELPKTAAARSARRVLQSP